MYAIIENGNKQYKVAEGDVVRVEKLSAKEGESVSFNTLMVSDGNGIRTGAEAAAVKVTATASSRGCSAFLLRRRSSRRRSRCSAIPTFPIAGRRAASGC